MILEATKKSIHYSTEVWRTIIFSADDRSTGIKKVPKDLVVLDTIDYLREADEARS